jgi:hypothetical protein
MKRRANNRLPILCAMCILATSLAGCKNQIALTSKWCDQGMDFGASSDEWGPATIYAEKEKVSLTLLNDGDYVYIRLNTRDRGIQSQLLMAGLTVWFNSDGSKRKTIGIRFPLGMHGNVPPAMARQGTRDVKAIERMTEEMNEIEILGPDKESVNRTFLVAAAASGINAKIGLVKGNLIYKLKFPLVKKDEFPYAVGINSEEIATSKVIGVGFETPKINRGEMRKNMGGEEPPGMPPGGTPPEGSGMLPSSGERPAAGERMPHGGMPEPLNLWTKVTLASEP